MVSTNLMQLSSKDLRILNRSTLARSSCLHLPLKLEEESYFLLMRIYAIQGNQFRRLQFHSQLSLFNQSQLYIPIIEVTLVPLFPYLYQTRCSSSNLIKQVKSNLTEITKTPLLINLFSLNPTIKIIKKTTKKNLILQSLPRFLPNNHKINLAITISQSLNL